MSSTFKSLAERDYAWFFGANFGFFMAIHMQFVLYGYLAFELTDSAKALSLVSAAVTIPTLVASPFAGALADRIDKRVLLAFTQAMAALASLALAALIFLDLVALWHIALVAVVVGSTLAINMPTRQAIIPQLVPRQKLMNAVSLQMGVMNLTMIIAPLVAGALIAPVGVAWVFVLSSCLFLVGTGLETKLPKHGMGGSGSTRHFLLEAREGFAHMAGNPVLRLLLVANTLAIMFSFPVQQTLPVFAKDVFDEGAAGLGILVAMSGAGGLIGAIVAAHLDANPWKGRALFGGLVLMGGLYGSFALAPSFPLALPLLALGASGQMFAMTMINTVVLSTVSPEMRGRTMAIMPMAVGLTPLAVFPVSVATDEVGAPTAIAVACALMLGLLLLLFSFAPALRRLRLDALRRTELSPAQAAQLVAEGKLSQDEADRLAGRDEAASTAPHLSPVKSEDALADSLV